MRTVLHPGFYRDATDVSGHYEQVVSPTLAAEFRQELNRCIEKAADRPESFAVRVHDLRRVNLRRFPYHVLFRVVGETVRILVLRHHRRDPTFGVERR